MNSQFVGMVVRPLVLNLWGTFAWEICEMLWTSFFFFIWVVRCYGQVYAYSLC